MATHHRVLHNAKLPDRSQAFDGDNLSAIELAKKLNA